MVSIHLTEILCHSTTLIFFYFISLKCSDVQQSGFCTSFCGWHSYAGNYKFAFIGLAPAGCPCVFQPRFSFEINPPNGNIAADGAVSVIAHELAEAATDPLLTGYCYSAGASTCNTNNAVENGDQCAWNFTNLRLYNNGVWNINFGFKNYLIQSNWNLTQKACTMPNF